MSGYSPCESRSGRSEAALTAAGVDQAAAGVIVGSDSQDVVGRVIELLAEHRVWDRFPAMSSPSA